MARASTTTRPTDTSTSDTGTSETGTPGTTSSDTVRWLTPLEMLAWRTYVETVTDLWTALEVDLAPTGLTTGDYQVLVYLSEAEDHSVRMCDLAGMLQLSPSGLTRRLDGLVKAGWVERRGSDTDRRVMLAVLTEAGLAKLVAAAPVHVASVRRRMIDLLDERELRTLAHMFATIKAALDESS